jgi:hypothetical protein
MSASYVQSKLNNDEIQANGRDFVFFGGIENYENSCSPGVARKPLPENPF